MKGRCNASSELIPEAHQVGHQLGHWDETDGAHTTRMRHSTSLIVAVSDYRMSIPYLIFTPS